MNSAAGAGIKERFSADVTRHFSKTGARLSYTVFIDHRKKLGPIFAELEPLGCLSFRGRHGKHPITALALPKGDKLVRACTIFQERKACKSTLQILLPRRTCWCCWGFIASCQSLCTSTSLCGQTLPIVRASARMESMRPVFSIGRESTR